VRAFGVGAVIPRLDHVLLIGDFCCGCVVASSSG